LPPLRARLIIDRGEGTESEKEVEIPILEGNLGPRVLDVRGIYAKTGMFTHDPGFTSTSSCTSAITFIDGEAGVLLHRGYAIDDLASNSDYVEVAYLLLNGDLPDQKQYSDFCAMIQHHSMVHEKLKVFIQGFKDSAHPMAVMVGVIGGLSAFYHNDLDITRPEQRALAAVRLIAKMPTIAAMAYKTAQGEPFIYPRHEYSYTENFLYMMFATPCADYRPSRTKAKALDTLLVLHADHEQNASTSTVRIAGSSDANPYACIASGIASLWGPMHGGANEACVAMLSEIGTADKIPEYLAKAKDKADPFRLMGFGHRVYKNHDPRATQMKKMCHAVLDELEETGDFDPELREFLNLAKELEKAALDDEYFIKRKLFPNVDFYSGITLTALGIPTSMFTVIFALGRTAGWISQWKESIEDPVRRISRPRQLYTGTAQRQYPLATRERRNTGDQLGFTQLAEAPTVLEKTPSSGALLQRTGI